MDFYFVDWLASTAIITRGSLEELDIFTRGDAFNATQKAAVLRFVNPYTYATLAPHASTKATRLVGQQEIYFVESRRGTSPAAGQTVDLSRNIAILVPPNLALTIKKTGDHPLPTPVTN